MPFVHQFSDEETIYLERTMNELTTIFNSFRRLVDVEYSEKIIMMFSVRKIDAALDCIDYKHYIKVMIQHLEELNAYMEAHLSKQVSYENYQIY